ncbi:MAG: hypothetical protein COA43_07365 [Robiginitomaculum sp.]|nr:MAG: hypothetical protein COA43_07365 [Robiginitomaculum sp.]
MTLEITNASKLLLVIAITFGMNACGYFSVKDQLYRKVNGSYGLDANCFTVIQGETPPVEKSPALFTVADFYEIGNRYCRIASIQKDAKGFILSPMACTTNHKRVSDSKSTFRRIDPFTVRVEPINKNTITFQEKDKDPVTVVKCGS